MNQLAAIASAAQAEDVPFLVAGGHAVITHGFPRSTFDLDLIVRRSDLEKWTRLAQKLGYELIREGPTFLQFNAAAAESFPLDLLIVNGDTFTKMQSQAVPLPSSAPGPRVISLMHLLALKCHAVKHGHSGRIIKDAEDVIQLIQINQLDPETPELRQLFLKHGTEEFYEKVRRACRSGE